MQCMLTLFLHFHRVSLLLWTCLTLLLPYFSPKRKSLKISFNWIDEETHNHNLDQDIRNMSLWSVLSVQPSCSSRSVHKVIDRFINGYPQPSTLLFSTCTDPGNKSWNDSLLDMSEDQEHTKTRLGCFDVTAILSWGWLKLRLNEVEVYWSWGWLKLRLIQVEVDRS